MNWPETADAGLLGDGRPASATDRPGDIDALRQAVARRVGEGYAIYPQGGRTALDYGGPPRRPGVAVDTCGLDRVVDYPFADMTITVEAGITLAALQNVLAEHNQRLPLEAPQPARATLGGIYATNTSGPRRFGAGRPRDLIIGVSFVTGQAELVKGGGRVVKNVAGYDFPRLLTGSMGTLGIIAQMTLKVRPRPECSAFGWASFDRNDAVAAALDRLNTSDTRPMAIELLNQTAAQRVGEPQGLPAAPWTLAIGYEDNTAAVAWQLDRLRGELAPAPLEVVEGSRADGLWQGLVESQDHEKAQISLLANLPRSGVAAFAGGLDQALWEIQAHAGSGIVRAHVLGERSLEEIAREIDALRAEAVRLGGNLILPRCPTTWKERLRVWGEPRADWALMERIKQALDPEAVMNPGRFVGTI